MSDRLTPEEQAEYLLMKEEKRLVAIIKRTVEEERCRWYDIDYNFDDPVKHRKDLAATNTALTEMVAAHKRNVNVIAATGRAIGSGSATLGRKAWDNISGILIALGLAWVASKLGVKIPGINS